ncbi:hypothetical protein GGI04_000781 [Coemansia thaxteri]|nr:hypothetical protein GGI04_000781 [Coemansia thaxteri]
MTAKPNKRVAVLDTECIAKTVPLSAASLLSSSARPDCRHPCFWSVLHGENLNFAYVSASLHAFLGAERSAAVSGLSLFDFIHPDEATRARHDLVDTFVSKPFLERKLSLPSLPEIAKLRASNGASAARHHSPLPKRLKTILEDSVGASGADHADCDEDNNRPPEDGDACIDSGYLIANIALYLVSTRLSIMVCHYEDSPPEGLLPLSPPPAPPPPPLLLPTQQPVCAPCDCAATTPIMADASRVSLLLSQVNKLDAIDSYRAQQPAMSPGRRPVHSASSAGLVSRHAQVYSVESKALLCAFPEDAYRKIYGRSPTDAANEGAGLCSLWKHCRDKKIERHATELLHCPGVPGSDPICLQLQVRSAQAPTALFDVQSLLFRWGHLLFVCQQMRSETSPLEPVEDAPLSSYNLSTPPTDPLGTRGNGSSNGGGLPPELAVRYDPSSPFYVGAGCRMAVRQPSSVNGHQPGSPADTRPFSLSRAPVSVAANLPVRPAIVTLAPVESVPPRRQSSYTLPPAKSFEERRFSYPTQALGSDRRQQPHPPLPPPPLLPPLQPGGVQPPSTSSSLPSSSSLLQQYHAQQAMSVCGPATPSSATSSYSMGGAPRGSPLGTVSSPGSRLADKRQRVVMAGNGISSSSSSNGMRGVGPLAYKSGNGDSTSASVSAQPTPNISPMSVSIAQHTPVSLSPAPQSSASGYVQVNIYPPPETSGSGSESWRWSQVAGVYNQTHAQRPPPPLLLSHPTQSPHALVLQHEQYQSPVASAVASPSMAAPSSAHRSEHMKKTCRSCGTDSSPEWRKGPNGHKT